MEVNYIWLIPFIPLIGVIINGTLGIKKNELFVSFVGCGVVFLAFLITLIGYIKLLLLPTEKRFLHDHLFTWIAVGSFKADFAFTFDPLSSIMALVVTGVGFLIHIYSIGYMHNDKGFGRYFTYLNLFIFSMLTLVLSDNLVFMFLGWEGVGLCSYLLIGFWYEDEEKVSAGKKAFILNRIGDLGFLFGIGLIFAIIHSLSFNEIKIYLETKKVIPSIITAISIGLFIGACGKSAQIPLYVWLPDAIAGPTPVSALIHSATIVTAGVYMVCRLNFLFILSPLTMKLISIIGLLTALFSALIALTQNDIKKILAYSTISQLGYMFLSVGVGLFSGAIFHLVTHAFFKACLFLGAGSVIHALGGIQDIRKMGGLSKKLKVTHWTFLFSSLAITGIVPFSGFFSKNEILWGAYASPLGGFSFWVIGFITAGLTAFYMFRLYFKVFLGEWKAQEHIIKHIHEIPPLMTIPLKILGILSLIGGIIGIPKLLGKYFYIENFIQIWLTPIFKDIEIIKNSHFSELIFMVLSLIISFFMIFIAYLFYKKDYIPTNLALKAPTNLFYTLSLNKFYIDEIYDYLIVRPIKEFSTIFLWKLVDIKIIDTFFVNGLGKFIKALSLTLRYIQNGNVQFYIFILFISIVIIFYYVVV